MLQKTIFAGLVFVFSIIAVKVVANMGAQTDPMPASQVMFYASFDDDLKTILARSDNTVFAIDKTKKNTLLSTAKNFGASLGLAMDQASPDAKGKTSLLLKDDQGKLKKMFLHLPGGDENGVRDEWITVKTLWSGEEGTESPLQQNEVQQIADAAISSWGLPVAGVNDKPVFSAATQVRKHGGKDEGPTRILRQTAGYTRKINDRQVINSFLTVDVGPISKNVVGFNLRSWWPLMKAEKANLKSAADIKSQLNSDILALVGAADNPTIELCQATYYQTRTHLLPSVSCTVLMTKANSHHKDMLVFTLPLQTDITPRLLTGENIQKLKDTVADYANQEEDDVDDLISGTVVSADEDEIAADVPRDQGDVVGDSFLASYLSNDSQSSMYLQGVERFYKDFGDVWSDKHIDATVTDNWYGGTDKLPRIEKRDLVYHVSHAGLTYLVTDDGLVHIFDDHMDVAELGVGDTDYVVATGCLAGSANYCMNKTAVDRHTDTLDWESLFNGLHIFSSNHGLSVAGLFTHGDKAKLYSEYLEDGMTLVEAWDNAEIDVNAYGHLMRCSVVDADLSTSCFEVDFTCSRYYMYPSSFFIDGKDEVTIYNRPSHSDDFRQGDSGYDIDLIYRYQDEQIPIYTEEHSLP